MKILRKLTRPLCVVLSLSMVALSMPMRTEAAMVGTGTLIAQEQVAIVRQRLATAIDRTEVQQQLAAMGVDPQQAKARIAAMTDEEIAALDGKLRQMPAGGDILGVAVFIFLVLLITDIAGYTNIFPFVKHGRR